jgi:hypothetical protein
MTPTTPAERAQQKEITRTYTTRNDAHTVLSKLRAALARGVEK